MSMKTSSFLSPKEVATDWGVTRTKQSKEAECNINNIIARFTHTGQLTHISQALGEYRDVSGLPDLHAAMNLVADANSTFQELPAEIRARCNHTVGDYLDFIDNPDNLDYCVEKGLLPAPAKTVPPPRDQDSLTPETETPTEGE